MSSSSKEWPIDRYILDYDYVSHLEAIRGLLLRNQQAEVALAEEITSSEERAREITGRARDFAVEYSIDLMSRSIYQDVAHSMAAVGMLAPFLEGVFKDAFDRMGAEWPRGDLVKKVLKFVDDTGLASYLPDRLGLTMEALFRYRNELFHWGFEWPAHIRQKFQDTTTRWPKDWFERAFMDDEIWLFSMSHIFIDQCVEVAEGVAEGLQDFLVDEGRRGNGLPPLGRQQGMW